MSNQRHRNRNSQQNRSGRGKVKNVPHDRSLGGGQAQMNKHQDERRFFIKPLVPKNTNQKRALNAFQTKQMVILTGSAGVGKSEMACWWASKLWLEGKVDNIIITRPAKGLGKDGGAVPGGDAMKLLNYCLSMLTKFRKYLGPGILKNNLRMDDLECLFEEKRGIQIVPLAKIQGLSFDENTLVIADEIQNADIAEVKALTTRCEDGCQLIIAGDPRQSAIRGDNGLDFLEKCLDMYPSPYCEIIRFTSDDIERGSLAAHMVRVFDKMGDRWLQ